MTSINRTNPHPSIHATFPGPAQPAATQGPATPPAPPEALPEASARPTQSQRAGARERAQQQEVALRSQIDAPIDRAKLDTYRVALREGTALRARLDRHSERMAEGRPLSPAEAQQIRRDMREAQSVVAAESRGSLGAQQPPTP